MKLIRGLKQLNLAKSPSAVSIGNYDGVHLGHQHVIKSLLEQSESMQVPSTVLTFEPLAKEFFNPGAVLRLSTIEERAQCLFSIGVEQVVCIDFNAEFASMSPHDFVKDVLEHGLGVRYVCVGDDFRFGKNRQGDFEFLQTYGNNHGFLVQAHDTFELEGERVSSGRVRQALIDNNFNLAARLLGRPFSITGTVLQGQKLGRTIGYPTANIVLPDNISMAVNGVYAVEIKLQNNKTVLSGVANVGKRPTVDGKENRVEVHIFDFDQTLYDQTIEVTFRHKVREEQKFADLTALKRQIKLDACQARGFFEIS